MTNKGKLYNIMADLYSLIAQDRPHATLHARLEEAEDKYGSAGYYGTCKQV